MAEVKKGKQIVLFWRLLKEAASKEAVMAIFQTEHSVERSRDADATETKSGPIRTAAVLEEEVPFTFLLANGDPTMDILEAGINDGEKVEQWEVDLNTKDESGNYASVYRQGYITELNITANAEDSVEVEGTFATDMLAQKGTVKLTEEEEKAIQYAFRNLDVYSEGEEEEES